jgi:hypothetical protein
MFLAPTYVDSGKALAAVTPSPTIIPGGVRSSTIRISPFSGIKPVAFAQFAYVSCLFMIRVLICFAIFIISFSNDFL